MRADIERQTEEFVRRGGKPYVAPDLVIVPKPIVPRTESIKRIKPERTRAAQVFWDDPDEVLALRFMKANGMTGRQIAEMLNLYWGNGRNDCSVNSFCNRNGIYVGRDGTHKGNRGNWGPKG